MLRGFKPAAEIARALDAAPELRALTAAPPGLLSEDPAAQRSALQALYGRVMTLPQAEVDRALDPLVRRLLPAYDAGALPREAPDYWAARAARQFSPPGGPHDRGLVSIYLLNLVRLATGEGTYLPAGVLHAYLEGVTVEIMANSDNVLRGGLTSKHVDVPGLLRAVSWESGPPAVLRGEAVSATERVYRTPAEEFELSRLEVGSAAAHRALAERGPDALVVVEGAATLEAGGERLELARGAAALVPAELAYAVEGKATLFKASLPRRVPPSPELPRSR
jgi:mannose-6-phosphate isomerase